ARRASSVGGNGLVRSSRETSSAPPNGDTSIEMARSSDSAGESFAADWVSASAVSVMGMSSSTGMNAWGRGNGSFGRFDGGGGGGGKDKRKGPPGTLRGFGGSCITGFDAPSRRLAP